MTEKKDVTMTDKENVDKNAKDAKGKKKEEVKLTEEDQKLKDEIDALAQAVLAPKSSEDAVTKLITKIQGSVGSLTGQAPKELKFVKSYYEQLEERYNVQAPGLLKYSFADLLSLIATTLPKSEKRPCLKYRLSGSGKPVEDFGPEYMRNLSGEICEEYAHRRDNGKNTDDLILNVKQIAPYNMAHNSQYEAVDLLTATEQTKMIPDLVTEKEDCSRVCLYLSELSNYASTDSERQCMLQASYDIHVKFKLYTDAVPVAFKMRDLALAQKTFELCEDGSLEQKQIAFQFARNRVPLKGDDLDDAIKEVASGGKFSEHFLALAKDLDVLEPKTPDDIYKTHLESGKNSTAGAVDSARGNLAATFVNAFVNAGYTKDKLMTEDGNAWLYKNKEHGMRSAAASLGMIYMGEVDDGLQEIDKFAYSTEDHIKAGALMAFGLLQAPFTCHEIDPLWALACEHLEKDSNKMQKHAAAVALGFGYAGEPRQDLFEGLSALFEDDKNDIECLSMAAVSLGLIFVGCANSADEENKGHVESIESMIMTKVLEMSEEDRKHALSRFFAVALGLLYLGCGAKCDKVLELCETVPGNFGQYMKLSVKTCAYAGTGDVLQVQELLHLVAEYVTAEDEEAKEAEGEKMEGEPEKKSDDGEWCHQGLAVLGIAMVGLGEKTGQHMIRRAMDHILQYSSADMKHRRAIPLALSILYASDPFLAVVDTLSKLSHDTNSDVANSAIIGLGLAGAGTNNARLAANLRQLAQFYAKSPDQLFLCRIAQGMIHMGKGLFTVSPQSADKMFTNPVSLAGLIVVMHCMLDTKNTILDKHHHLLFHFVHAMRARHLTTLDEDLAPKAVSVRVGEGTDIAGVPGKPRTITGFQTNNTPVLLNLKDRAELVDDEFLPVTEYLSDVVILKKNPDFDPEKNKK